MTARGGNPMTGVLVACTDEMSGWTNVVVFSLVFLAFLSVCLMLWSAGR